MAVMPLVVKVGYRYIDSDQNFVDIIRRIDDVYSDMNNRGYRTNGAIVGLNYPSLVKEVCPIDLSDKIDEIGLEATPLTLEVGKSYINGNKAIVTIESVNHGSPLPLFIDNYGHSYSNWGVYNWSSNVRSNLDLVEEVFLSIEDSAMGKSKRPPISLKVGYSYLNTNDNTVDIVKYDGGIYYSDLGVPFYGDGSYCQTSNNLTNMDIPKQPDLISEIGPMVKPIAVTGSHSVFPKEEPQSYLTAADIQNISNYIDKIEQIVNRVGLRVEIKLDKLESEG